MSNTVTAASRSSPIRPAGRECDDHDPGTIAGAPSCVAARTVRSPESVVASRAGRGPISRHFRCWQRKPMCYRGCPPPPLTRHELVRTRPARPGGLSDKAPGGRIASAPGARHAGRINPAVLTAKALGGGCGGCGRREATGLSVGGWRASAPTLQLAVGGGDSSQDGRCYDRCRRANTDRRTLTSTLIARRERRGPLSVDRNRHGFLKGRSGR